MCIKIEKGAKVWIKRDIYEPADEHPAGWVAYKGDLLEVVRLGWSGLTAHVRHPYVKDGSYFVVALEDLMDQSPLITVLEQEEYIKRHGHARGGFEPFNGRLQLRSF